MSSRNWQPPHEKFNTSRDIALQFAKGKEKKEYADPVLRALQRGITMRNQLVYKPTAAPSSEEVEPVLWAVRDLLGMLDYYAGGTPMGASFISVGTHRIWWHSDAKKPE